MPELPPVTPHGKLAFLSAWFNNLPWSRSTLIPATCIVLFVLTGGIWGGVRVWQQRQRTLQCQTLINTIEQAYVRILEFQGDDANAIEQLADNLQTVAGELRAIEIRERQLQDYQAQFVTAYQQMGDAYGQMADEIRRIQGAKPNLQADSKALVNIKRAQALVKRNGADVHTAARQLDQLAITFNQYCGAGRS